MDKVILLIGENGEKLGKVSLKEAQEKARAAGKDLVLVNDKEQVYKIVNLDKLRFDKQQKEKQNRNSKANKLKEIKINTVIAQHDLEVKAKHIEKFLKDKIKTKIIVQYKKRQMSDKSVGIKKLQELINPFIESGLASLDKEPTFDGMNLVAYLVPSK